MDSGITSISDSWSRKMRLGCVHRVLFFKVKKGMTEYAGSFGRRKLSSVKKR